MGEIFVSEWWRCSHLLYITHNATISFISLVSGKELFISPSNMDESEGCSHSHLWLLVDVYHLGEIFRGKQRQDELCYDCPTGAAGTMGERKKLHSLPVRALSRSCLWSLWKDTLEHSSLLCKRTFGNRTWEGHTIKIPFGPIFYLSKLKCKCL